MTKFARNAKKIFAESDEREKKRKKQEKRERLSKDLANIEYDIENFENALKAVNNDVIPFDVQSLAVTFEKAKTQFTDESQEKFKQSALSFLKDLLELSKEEHKKTKQMLIDLLTNDDEKVK